jgi:hypothetical protein
MAIKELQTRIALKYDSYENWLKTDDEGQGGNLVLLPGEIGICEIPGTVKSFIENGKTVTVETAPTVLFKVGNTEKKAFKDLPWASAKAADVYGWAKASDVVLNETAVDGSDVKVKTLNFVGTDKSITLNYLTPEEVKAITDPIAEDLADLSEVVDGIKQSLETLMGDETGSVADAIAAAERRAADDAKSKANTAEQNAKTYAKGLDDVTNGRVDDVIEDVAANTEDIAENAQAIADEKAAREAAIGVATNGDTAATGLHAVIEAGDKVINDKIGTGFDTTNTVAKAVKAAQDAADAAQADVDALTATEGVVTSNTSRIGELEEAVAGINETIVDLQDADDDFEDRIARMEAFFGTADKDGEDTDPAKTVYDALDTLKEIQDYIVNDGQAASDMLDAINANAQAIEDTVGENGTITRAVAQNAEDIADLDERVGGLETLTAGLGTDDSGNAVTVKAYVDAAKAAAISTAAGDATGKANTAETNAKTHATNLNSAMNTRVTTLETASGEHAEAIAENAQAIADETAARIAAIGAATNGDVAATGVYAALEAGDKAINDKIGTIEGTVAEAIEAANTAASNAQDAADAAQGTADEAAAAAGENAEAIAAIQADYVKVKENGLYFGEDMIIFNCGSASTVI